MGYFKVLPLLNKCGDPSFLLQNLNSLKMTTNRQRLYENLLSVLFQGNDLNTHSCGNGRRPLLFRISAGVSYTGSEIINVHKQMNKANRTIPNWQGLIGITMVPSSSAILVRYRPNA